GCAGLTLQRYCMPPATRPEPHFPPYRSYGWWPEVVLRPWEAPRVWRRRRRRVRGVGLPCLSAAPDGPGQLDCPEPVGHRQGGSKTSARVQRRGGFRRAAALLPEPAFPGSVDIP